MSSRILTFGEVMLRLKSPGHERLLQSPTLEATFGGGEANVAVSLAQFGRSFLAEWLLHLRRRVRALAMLHSSVVVEGYALDEDCRNALQDDVADPVEVFPIEVVDRTYFYTGQRVTLEQVAALAV